MRLAARRRQRKLGMSGYYARVTLTQDDLDVPGVLNFEREDLEIAVAHDFDLLAVDECLTA